MIADATGSSRSQGCRDPLPELSVVLKEYPGEEKTRSNTRRFIHKSGWGENEDIKDRGWRSSFPRREIQRAM